MIEQQFSLLMCVCPDDSPDHFNLALKSVTLHQIKKPDEAIIVLDGNVGIEITQIIKTVFSEVSIEYHIIKNKKQIGLAQSLNLGLELCSKEWVARMDADDIALPKRFDIQMEFISRNPSIAVLGSSIREFGDHIEERDKIAITDSKHIKQRLKFRNPINHPSCIINRPKIQSVGGYPKLEKNQDYGLWLILVAEGYELANIDKVLLKFRITKNFFSKRGVKLLKHDLKILHMQKKLGFISSQMMLFMAAIRIVFRALPTQILKLIYSASRR